MSSPEGARPRRVASACDSTERFAPVSMMKRNGPWPLMLMSATARPAASLVVHPRRSANRVYAARERRPDIGYRARD